MAANSHQPISNSYKLLTFDSRDINSKDVTDIYPKSFSVMMFGMNEQGESICINVDGFNPFFYIMVGESWESDQCESFMSFLNELLPPNIYSNIISFELVQNKKLYGFDGGKEYNFLKLSFKTEQSMKKTADLWFDVSTIDGVYNKQVKPKGLEYNGEKLTIYESNIPPVLRLFHIQEISPSGWIQFDTDKITNVIKKLTTCKYEVNVHYSYIKPILNKETIVPFKICSFDIEASSSHGDFPLAIKNYKKLATNIVDICTPGGVYYKSETNTPMLKQIILKSFGLIPMDLHDNIDLVFPQIPVSTKEICELFDKWVEVKPAKYEGLVNFNTTVSLNGSSGSSYFNNTQYSKYDEGDDADSGGEGIEGNDNDDEYDNDSVATTIKHLVVEEGCNWNMFKPKVERYKNGGTILDLLSDTSVSRETQMVELIHTLTNIFPPLHGDNVTFIGSTFINFGEETPYLNHCITVNTCDKVNNATIKSCLTERELLLEWTRLIQREDPDIIIGYNTFGFDYQFMFQRASELKCVKPFLQLSRVKGEVCLKNDWRTGKDSLDGSVLMVASGHHEIKYVNMTGRLQIDLYTYFKRDYILPAYKLDFVAGHFIGDTVSNVKHIELPNGNMMTEIYSKNIAGLESNGFVCFSEDGNSVEKCNDGKKYEVISINKTTRMFAINGLVELNYSTKKIKWGLAKDDVSPQQIFHMTNQGPVERAVIAKYCIQDCNLVHQLMRKIDVLTEFTEMSSLCSVPIQFLVLRGQSIKLTSYIAKKCRERNTLMPVISKQLNDNDGYEGATVFEPKCGFYTNNPVACLDYSSMYPSGIISENISHDSKVYTKQYDIKRMLISESGIKNSITGKFVFDNLPGYIYVDIEYNMYKWQHKNNNPKAAKEKVKVGYKVCRWAQFPIDPSTGKPRKAVIPSILEELLLARKQTRKQMALQTDEFMENILNKRQLSIKVTANSVYGQMGARTSSFYEKDCAASTTAIGRKLLTYAKRVVEETFTGRIKTSYGDVLIKSECIYGDTDSVFVHFNMKTIDGKPMSGKESLPITIELAKMAGIVATKFLKQPHELEYEKTFLPFCLLSKKRYVGMMYGDNDKSCKRKSMGIVLKRRDNASIVKDIYGGIIDILMSGGTIETSVVFLKDQLNRIVDKKCSMDKLVITKALRSSYKMPKSIAHKVLADRMGSRDPGNKPSTGDRIPYVFIVIPNSASLLQGDRIETPSYIKDNKLKVDYEHYITNQIMVPVQQIFSLLLENMVEFKKRKGGEFLNIWKKELTDLHYKYQGDETLYLKKEIALRNKEVNILLFDDVLRKLTNEKKGNVAITSFFSKVK